MWHPLLHQEIHDGWLLDPEQTPILRDRFLLMIKPQYVSNSNLGTFPHLTRYDLLNGVLNKELDLSPGETTVLKIYGVNELKQIVYYSAVPPNEPSQKQLYSVSLQIQQGETPVPNCISCSLKTPEGKYDDIFYISFSS